MAPVWLQDGITVLSGKIRNVVVCDVNCLEGIMCDRKKGCITAEMIQDALDKALHRIYETEQSPTFTDLRNSLTDTMELLNLLTALSPCNPLKIQAERVLNEIRVMRGLISQDSLDKKLPDLPF